MKQCSFSTIIAIALMCMMFTSCSYVRWVGVDRLTPANIDLSERVRRVAVLSNQYEVENEGSVYYLDAKAVTDSLAQYLADVAYFDEVVVGDTILTDGAFHKDGELLPSVVAKLCEVFGVDMLVTIDNVSFVPYGVESSFVKGQLRAEMTYYEKWGTAPISHVQKHYTFDWEYWHELKSQAVYLAALWALPMIVPQWKLEEFPFYTGANVWQRDAAVYVREGNWDGAANLWRQQLIHKNRRRRMEAHLNMAVYHEMRDDNVEIARTHAQKALELSEERLKMKDGKPVETSSDYHLISEYIKEMERRGHDLERLKQQMYRFSNEF